MSLNSGIGLDVKIDEEEVPQNGWAGLKYWRHDMMAGSLLWIVALVYCLGIAEMSGFPLVAGVWTAILAGFLFPLIRGSYLTISGPGVGLAPLMLWTVMSMGNGDKTLGHERTLVVIFVTGLLMVILSRFKVASLGKMFPPGVIHGMLAAIGLIAVTKQIPHFLGVHFEGHHFTEILGETPTALGNLFIPVVLVAGLCLTTLLLLDYLKKNWAQKSTEESVLGVLVDYPKWWIRTFPSQVTVVVAGVVAGIVVGLQPQYLATIPTSLSDGFTFPDFKGVLTDASLIAIFMQAVILLLLVDGIESVATVLGIDGIDPWQRKSDPDRIWLAMGTTNMLGSFIGCMPVIPGGMKSTFNKELGARTLWANFYTALFLLLALLFASDLIRMIPMAVLAAVLIQVGSKLTVKMIQKTRGKGAEEWSLFALTAGSTLMTDDLVVGIGVGLITALGIWIVKGLSTATSENSIEVPVLAEEEA